MLTDVFIGLLNGDNLNDLSNKSSESIAREEVTPEVNNNYLNDITNGCVDDSADINCMGDDFTFVALDIENF